MEEKNHMKQRTSTSITMAVSEYIWIYCVHTENIRTNA